jgi:hypothetical protein
MGSLNVKNASEKFSRLGTFNQKQNTLVDYSFGIWDETSTIVDGFEVCRSCIVGTYLQKNHSLKAIPRTFL